MSTKRKRKGLSVKLRFEVFKRDKFTCQYCGAKAPDVILQCDHIEPHAKGGADSILNLITSCAACNGGKGDRRISEEAELAKTRVQLEELEERRQQLEMMAQWRTSLVNYSRREIDLLAEHWNSVSGFGLNELGRRGLSVLLKSFTFQEIADGMEGSVKSYCGGGASSSNADVAFYKIRAVCGVKRRERENPGVSRLYYCRGILRKRFPGLDEARALGTLQTIYNCGVAVEEIEAFCKSTTGIADLEEFTDSVYAATLS